MTNSQKLHMKVKKALKLFMREDKDLLCRNVNERSITHKIAEHLQSQFKELKVDCEYNRHGSDTKTILKCVEGQTSTDCVDAVTVYPDIVVHKRGVDACNLLVIEVKKSNGNAASRDKWKLKQFTDPKQYKYKLGLFLEIDIEKKQIKSLSCFKKGSKNLKCDDCKQLRQCLNEPNR